MADPNLNYELFSQWLAFWRPEGFPAFSIVRAIAKPKAAQTLVK